MAVIKGSTPGKLLKEAVVLDLGDLARQASKLRVAAEDQASQILDQAEQEARRLSSEASQVGHAEGHAKGLAQGIEEGRTQGHQQAFNETRDQLQQIAATWTQGLQDFEQGLDQVEQQARDAILEFAILFAEKITHRVIQMDNTVVLDQLANALQHVLRPLDVVVQVHPDDRPMVEQAIPELLAEFTQVQRIDLTEKPEVGRGGCIVVFGQGRIDASIETQLDRLVETILPLPDAPAATVPSPQAPQPATPDAGAVQQMLDQVTDTAQELKDLANPPLSSDLNVPQDPRPEVQPPAPEETGDADPQ